MEKHTQKDGKRNSPVDHETGQPQPHTGSHKAKNRKHSRAKHNSHHDM